MRQGQQHRRGRGRNNISNNNNNNNSHQGNRKGQNPLTRSFESSGPDVKVRGTPAHIAEKYMQLARDAQSSGDHVLAENYLQHAEHYNRIIFAYREQQIQQSGEMMNGGGRPHPQQGRQEFLDTDDASSDGNGVGDDSGPMDEAPFSRHRADHPRDAQPSFDEPRQHHPRQDQQPRFRDRHPRGDRSDQSERFERRERSFRGSDQPSESREPRPEREPREHREPRIAHEPHREIAPPPPPVENGSTTEQASIDNRAAEVPAPRRRERFGLGADQPEFLRRPVRRPRREPEQEFAPEPPRAMPSTEEPPRE
ncbi:MAG: DUF4167 domain-containing protein [Hyphomicrobiaceae bacterium]